MILIDTSVIIDHLRASAKVDESYLLAIVDKHGVEAIAISVLTIQELYEGRSTRNAAKEREMLSVISPLAVLPYTYDVGEYAGMLARDLERPIEFADAAIAATAILNGCTLATLNTKDFEQIKGLEMLTREK